MYSTINMPQAIFDLHETLCRVQTDEDFCVYSTELINRLKTVRELMAVEGQHRFVHVDIIHELNSRLAKASMAGLDVHRIVVECESTLTLWRRLLSGLRVKGLK